MIPSLEPSNNVKNGLFNLFHGLLQMQTIQLINKLCRSDPIPVLGVAPRLPLETVVMAVGVQADRELADDLENSGSDVMPSSRARRWRPSGRVLKRHARFNLAWVFAVYCRDDQL
jgi:hypothetical protein